MRHEFHLDFLCHNIFHKPHHKHLHLQTLLFRIFRSSHFSRFFQLYNLLYPALQSLHHCLHSHLQPHLLHLMFPLNFLCNRFLHYLNHRKKHLLHPKQFFAFLQNFPPYKEYLVPGLQHILNHCLHRKNPRLLPTFFSLF